MREIEILDVKAKLAAVVDDAVRGNPRSSPGTANDKRSSYASRSGSGCRRCHLSAGY
jgi:hypothetical protein